MLNIKCFEVNIISENCYVVSDETKECVIIDCGAWQQDEKELIDGYIKENNLKVVEVLNTHGHFDHTWGNRHIYDKYGIKPRMCKEDSALYANLAEQVKSFLNYEWKEATAPLGEYLVEEQKIEFGKHELEVIFTPGHTRGGLCLYCKEERVLFTGDTLFYQSIGRTDFPGGNINEMMQSLHKISALPRETKVYPGHGPSTTIGTETDTNMYLR